MERIWEKGSGRPGAEVEDKQITSQIIQNENEEKYDNERNGSDYDIPNENVQIEIIDVPNWTETVQSHQNTVFQVIEVDNNNNVHDINSIKNNCKMGEGNHMNDMLNKCLCQTGGKKCDICVKQFSILENRAQAKTNLEKQSEKMKRISNEKFPSCCVGDTVRVPIPDLDSGRCDFNNALMTNVHADNDNGYYELTVGNIKKETYPQAPPIATKLDASLRCNHLPGANSKYNTTKEIATPNEIVRKSCNSTISAFPF
ncbi:hypothetical protein NQ317_019597 [Molorchus minor]|uniref:Uncharacterized protein n=1 Tax=Molorchus minor TaxID=1323400 RepID=A0ABQ9J5J5_9CUCU|nr:hypothetical protein NQ317_019597 [Molorchus minor]